MLTPPGTCMVLDIALHLFCGCLHVVRNVALLSAGLMLVAFSTNGHGKDNNCHFRLVPDYGFGSDRRDLALWPLTLTPCL